MVFYTELLFCSIYQPKHYMAFTRKKTVAPSLRSGQALRERFLRTKGLVPAAEEMLGGKEHPSAKNAPQHDRPPFL
jgi:hypothetical protein